MKEPENTTHACKYKPVRDKPMLYMCLECKNIHKCGVVDCENLHYNSDYTRVCTLTGLCFEQRICETFVDATKPMNGDDPIYIKRPKRDQQIKNKHLDRNQIIRIVECASSIVELTPLQINVLCAKIMDLWTQFVNCMNTPNPNKKATKSYVHRKDKRCFVIAIIMSLEDGIMIEGDKFVVTPHEGIKCAKLNKKSEYPEFEVSDIRYGQTLIKRVFNGTDFDSRYSVYIHSLSSPARRGQQTD